MNVYRGAHNFVSGRTVSPLAVILFGLSRKFGAGRIEGSAQFARKCVTRKEVISRCAARATSFPDSPRKFPDPEKWFPVRWL